MNSPMDWTLLRLVSKGAGVIPHHQSFVAFCLDVDFRFLPTNGFSIKPLKVKPLAGEQKATENPNQFRGS